MKKYLSEYEERLVELVHALASGTPEEYGLTLNEVKKFLIQKVSNNEKTPLELIKEGDKFVQEVKDFLQTS